MNPARPGISREPVGVASAANTGAAGAMHRVGFSAGKPAPTGYADRLRIQGVRPGMSETRQ
ncbi:hypothetical protein DBB42_07440 [Pseudomonas plecoglossicida]|uniref:Uncharacterized protein n=1 Tax=Pseudomonas plecoglossicida TaxID=70775 RepID=A0A2R7UL74_PSEDL|nr:hypothetical protein DBB42_07440 [Pseudomonas plecoglossicida]